MEGIQVHGRACFPVGFFYELKGLFRLAWPTSLSILFHYFIQPVSLMFCGHLGKTELASVAMALSMIYISCISIGRGLAFGGDTFFSQTYGSKNKMKMGVYLQKGMLFGILCSFFIWAVLINTEKILLLLRQEEHVAKMAQDYIDYFLPGALAYCWIFTLMRYLLCQNSVIPNLLICMASCGINALLHYCLVSVAGLGIRGSAISLVLTYYIVFILLLSYIWFSGIHRETWPGWNRECLEEWDIFGRVAFSSIFMTFIFWFCTEIGTFLAGLLSEEDISAFSICFQVEGFAWMIPLGLGSASTARIGQYLGSKNALGAITTCRVAIAIQGIISVLMAVFCYLMRYYIPIAFTSNSDLIKYTGDILPLVAIFLFLEGFGGIGISIIRGTGRQTLGAIIIFISFYIVALPVGIPLMFVTKLRLSGLWWGFVLGLVVQNICLFAFVARMNWQAETDKAQIRAGVYFANQHLEERNHSEINEEQDNNESEVLLDEPLDETQAYQAERDDELIIRPSLQKLILKRFPIFMAFLLLLVAGICIRVFLPKSKVDCINANLHNASTFNLLALNNNSENVIREQFFHFEKYSLDHSVPWCNDTQKPYLQSAQSKLMYSTAYLRI